MKELEALGKLKCPSICICGRSIGKTKFVKEQQEAYHTVKFALERKEKLEKVFEIIKNHKLLNYVFKNDKCASAYKLTTEEIETLKEVINVKD